MDYIKLVSELTGGSATYHIRTFGCLQNDHDSEKIAGLLESMGYSKSDDLEKSDVIIYNTCCVRESAEQKVYGHLGRLKKVREKRPETVIILCGCMVQQRKTVEKVNSKYGHVDVIFGTHRIHRLPEFLYSVLCNRKRVIDTGMDDEYIHKDVPVSRMDSKRARVTVTSGCNNYCTYCVVPYVRGSERSREKNKILAEIEMLARSGCREVTLIGQNVNSYGKDTDGHTDFAELLYSVNQINGIKWIRFVTSHPKDFSQRLVRAMKECSKVCRHMHLPVQSGSNRILKMMNRGYTREQYIEKVMMLREEIPEIAITTDIITGFPGETEKDFSDTLDIVQRIRYDSAYTFIYSKREGTEAALMEGHIDTETKKKRFNRLVRLQNSISLDINKTYTGKKVEVLAEGPSKKDAAVATGRSEKNKIVNFTGKHIPVGDFVSINITGAKTWYLEGRV